MNSNCYMNRKCFDLNIPIKKLHQNAIIPSYSKEGDAGLDLTAISVNDDELFTEYCTGLAIQIPKGYVGLIFPRSSVSNKTLMLKNCVGVIDSGYRGEIKCRFQKFYNSQLKLYNIGDKIAQIIIMPYPSV